MEKRGEASVLIQNKSDWQKTNCLFCREKATKEAVCGNAYVRCCDKKNCQDEAKKLAVISNTKQ